MEEYRFDDAYGKVYGYDRNSKSYIFRGSYHAYGLTADMSAAEKTREVEEQDLFE